MTNAPLLEGTLYPNSSIQVPVRSERRTPIVMALVLLPWIAAVLFTAGIWPAINLLGYAAVVFTVGYSIISAALPANARSRSIFLAPAAGILAVSALTAFWVRLGLPLIWTPAIWLALTAIGMLGLWRDRGGWAKSTVAYGLTLTLFSVLICAVYFLPSARNDLVQRRDGSFNWRSADTQHFHSIAASIKTSVGPPKSPGTATAELLYHFGPYAPAAAISRLDGLDLGDAVARVTRGASLWGFVVSCFGLGTFLSLKATGTKFGGIMSLVGLFFYGSLLAMFMDEVSRSGHVTGGIFFTIPGVDVRGDGGPFSSLLTGHSSLHGLIAITVIVGICLAGSVRESLVTRRSIVLLLLPVLVVPVNSVAALYCVGIAGIILFWGRVGSARSWLLIALMVGLFLGAWKIMGYGHAPDAAQMMINHHPGWEWWTLTLTFIVGLGFRIEGFRWISRPFTDTLSAVVLVTVLGLLTFSLLVRLRDGNERYGMDYLFGILSILAFSRVTSGSWHGAERSRMIAEWLKLAKIGMIVFSVAGVLIGCIAVATYQPTGTRHFGAKLILSFLFLFVLAAASVLMKRSRRFSTVGSALLMCALMPGFLAWTPIWLRHGVEAVNADSTNITYSAGEVRGLRRLGELMSPGEQFATNKHALNADGLEAPINRSYGYSALSERPVLLEGYLDRGETELPWFSTLLQDNDSLFITTDPETLRRIAKSWQVQWLVARPGTDISLSRPLPDWLVEQRDCGDLKIYRIN